MQPSVRRWATGRPSATTLAVALSVGAFGAQLLVEVLLADHPSKYIFREWLALDGAGMQNGQWWKFLSFGLLHGDVLHLAANMLLLYFAGREVEPIVGSRHFLGLYLGGNVLGGLAYGATLALHHSAFAMPPLLGVSAGVATVVVAFTTILPELEVTMNLLFVFPLRLRAKYLAYALLAVSALCWATSTAPQIGPAGMFVGAILGWFYVKQLGFGNPLFFQRRIFEKRQRVARLERMTSEQFVQTEIDPVLDKIAQRGMKSLTRAERKILELGCAKMSGKDGRK